MESFHLLNMSGFSSLIPFVESVSLLNTSNVSFLVPMITDRYISTMGFVWDVTIGTIMSIIIIIGTLLNSTVILTLTVCKTRRNQREKEVITEYFIIILAISDLAAVSLCYPFAAVSSFYSGWMFGELGCVIFGCVGFMLNLISSLVVVCFAMYRALNVIYPFSPFLTRKCYLVTVMLALVMYSMIWTIPPIFGWGKYGPEAFGTSCTVDWAESQMSYLNAIFIFSLALPFTAMFMSYGLILLQMRQRSQVFAPKIGKRKWSQTERKITKMAIIMWISFLLLWLPYVVLSLLNSYLPNFYPDLKLSAISTLITKAIKIVNPCLYFAMTPTCKGIIKKIYEKESKETEPDVLEHFNIVKEI